MRRDLALLEGLVETWLARSLPARDASPARLHGAMHAAVFPGERRSRALVCCLVAGRYADGIDEMVGRVAAAIELVHCASLVQDTSSPTSILAGDALFTLAFESLCTSPIRSASLALRLVGVLTQTAGSRSGIIGGQTAALFRAAAMCGAICCGADEDVPRWAALGESIGRSSVHDVERLARLIDRVTGLSAVRLAL